MVRLCGLTFELSCARRQTTTGRGRTMTTMAWSGQALAAVARQLERGVRQHSRHLGQREQDLNRLIRDEDSILVRSLDKPQLL